MFYIKTILVFALIFFISNIVLLQLREFYKNTKRIKQEERRILWKMPKLYLFLYTVLPSITSKLLFRAKNKLTEEQLLEMLNILSLNLSGGVSVIESIKQAGNNIASPLKNELSLFLFLNEKNGLLQALHEMQTRSKNIYLKLLWGILAGYAKNGGSLSQNLKNFALSMNSKISMESRIKGQLIQTKIQMCVGVALPYLLFVVMWLLYPNITEPAFHSTIGQGILLVAFILHATGTYFFIIITRFDNKKDLRDIMAIECLVFSIQSGFSILKSFEDISKNELCENSINSIINSCKTSVELIGRLKELKNTNLSYAIPVLEKSLKLGIPVAADLLGISENLRFKLEQRANKFQQTAPTKALIPLFLCIFPATYLLILAPVIVEIMNSSF